MPNDQQYEAWRKRRAEVPPPGDFADRVMAAIHRARQRVRAVLLRKLLAAAMRSRFVRAAVCSLALAVWVVRAAIALLVFFPQ